MIHFDDLREQNASRRDEWHGDSVPWLCSDWSNAMAGECGEACNIVKKIRRHETSIGSSYNTPEMDVLLAALKEELADVITYADLLAHFFGIDLGEAVMEKFNKVSEAQGFPQRLGQTPRLNAFGVPTWDRARMETKH